jgi:hypothetical protein
MSGGTGDAPVRSDRIRARDLAPRDIVSLEGSLFEVLSKPFLGMTGSSVLDTQQLFWRAFVRPLGGRQRVVQYTTWCVDEAVTVCRRGDTKFTPSRRS